MEDNAIVRTSLAYAAHMKRTGIHHIIKGRSSSEIFSDFYNSISTLGILPSSHEDPKWTKSADDSIQLRNMGNIHFENRNMMNALKLYTRAIGKALEGSAEIAQAYSNRSAVTFHIGEYNDCLINIELALSGNYQKNLIYKLHERKGDCLTALKDTDGAISAYETALTSLKVHVGESKAHDMHQRIENKIIQSKKIPTMISNKKEHESSKPFFELSHPPSATIECASEAVSIQFSKQYGRMVVANVDISPGDVLALERPSTCIKNPKECLFCSFCLKRCHSSVPCPYCTLAFFCNDDCRDKSWKQSHEIECSLFPSLISIGCGKLELLAVHSLILMTKQGTALPGNIDHYRSMEKIKRNPDFQARGFVGGKYPSETIETAYFLESCEDKRDLSNKTKLAVVAACVFKLVKDSKHFGSIANTGKLDELSQMDSIVGGMLLQFLLIVPICTQPIAEMMLARTVGRNITTHVQIGWGLFNFLALLNHSCDPNVTRYTSKDHREVLSTIKTIKKGEQLFENYGSKYTVHTLPVRKQRLDRYFFTCRCQPCLEDWAITDHLPIVGKCLPGTDDRITNYLIGKFAIICEIIRSGDVDQLPFLLNCLTQIEQTCKMPSIIYALCQEAIMQCFDYKGNCYIIKK